MAVTEHLVLTIISDDRPGLVESLAQTVAKHSGNWLESRMSLLAGKFAGILRLSVPKKDAQQLIDALKGLSNELNLVVERAGVKNIEANFQAVDLNLVGNDRPGIVSEISSALARLSVNVEELNTECVSSPMSSDALFKASATLNVPAGLDLEKLQSELEQLSDDLIVEIQLN